MNKKAIINNEMEFKSWFVKNYRKLGFSKIVRNDEGTYPDFIMLRDGKEVRVELETLTSHFNLHNHNLNDVDEIVCIKKDIKLNAPIIEIKELDFINEKERISISLEKETVDRIKNILGKTIFRNQSHLVETAIKEFVEKQEVEIKKEK